MKRRRWRIYSGKSSSPCITSHCHQVSSLTDLICYVSVSLVSVLDVPLCHAWLTPCLRFLFPSVSGLMVPLSLVSLTSFVMSQCPSLSCLAGHLSQVSLSPCLRFQFPSVSGFTLPFFLKLHCPSVSSFIVPLSQFPLSPCLKFHCSPSL